MYISVLHLLADLTQQNLDLGDGPAQAIGERHETECLEGLQKVRLGPRACLSVSLL
jgi:hypothetical protein